MYKDLVYQLVRQIPKGRVATYGQVASKLKMENGKWKISPRSVGFILHQNKSADVPCHRVVDRNGRIAKNFAFGGAKEQRNRLLAEGVVFANETHVDLQTSLYRRR